MYQNILINMYGFCLENAMGYGISESMGYGLEFPAYRHGSSKILWGMREYGLSGVWVMRVLTVYGVYPRLYVSIYSYRTIQNVDTQFSSSPFRFHILNEVIHLKPTE